ncbi:hypothetical protein RAC89_18070 [Paenibacillus sp. GD4]|nr:hypothetical protein [Paenibacillus sp. GD4]MDQ1912299.1 hypothetical protein [Paenibacillus sp. GD4]
MGWMTVCVKRPDGFYSDAVVDKAYMADYTISSFDELDFLVEGGHHKMKKRKRGRNFHP